MQDLNKADIQNIMLIIDLATQKGVFKAQDLSTIGQLYSKLNLISNSIQEHGASVDSYNNS